MRNLDWDGCVAAGDLGGLRTADGRTVRPGALVRADSVDGLTAAGWAALGAHGVRTVLDLRNPDERDRLCPRPPGVATLLVPLDVVEDRAFWDTWAAGPQFGTPLYYGPWLRRFPHRAADAVAAIARAPEGGVLFHCVRGRDRTGLVALLVLSLLGVPPAEVAADYARSAERVRPHDPYAAAIDVFLRDRGATGAELVLELLATVDVAASLRSGGLADEDLDRLRIRALE
jgi:protein-tyrosine phosphatase